MNTSTIAPLGAGHKAETHFDGDAWGGTDRGASGDWMHAFASELFPICRSITGEGLRTTLRRIQQEIPIAIHEVPSGTQVLDWTVPEEWNIRDAWIANARGERLIDFHAHNLHVASYSTPLRARMSLDELRPHLHSLPQHPDWIPYRTSYYKRTWGFCLTHRQLQQLEPGEYDVCIDSTLAPGALSYGELLLRGASEDEFLVSVHCCHPSLANDNLSGVAVAVALAKMLSGRATLSSARRAVPALNPETIAKTRHAGDSGAMPGLRHSIRFLFIPGTIGAITWLARNEEKLARVKAGLVLTCIGDAGPFTYKKSRRGHAAIDRSVAQALRDSGQLHRVIDFFPYGYDERQYGSPGFNLPVGCFMRSQHGTFPEYHSSADNLNFIKPDALEESLRVLLRVIEASGQSDLSDAPTTNNQQRTTNKPRFLNLKPKGEPHLVKYDIHAALDGDVLPALWVLNFSDGGHALDEIAAKSGLPFDKLLRAADILCTRGLLKEVKP